MPSNPNNLSPQQVADRAKLKAMLKFEERVLALGHIGRDYGVVIKLKTINQADKSKSIFTRTCPIHGEHDVQMRAFLIKGKFGCHLCAQERQIEKMKSKGRV